jgi:hypothetical protein
MEINLYTNKQILGGVVLVIIIGLLFVVNLSVMNNNDGFDLVYFISPLIFAVCAIAILYILSLQKSIKSLLNL